MNKIDLIGKNSVITGGASGLGLAIVLRMIESGSSIDIWDINKEKLETLFEDLSNKYSTQNIS